MPAHSTPAKRRRNPRPDDDAAWARLRALFPKDLDALARDTGALRRARQLDSGHTLLRLLLLYVTAGFSLAATAAWAAYRGLAELSDEALRKRFANAQDFLLALLTHVLTNTLRGRPRGAAAL